LVVTHQYPEETFNYTLNLYSETYPITIAEIPLESNTFLYQFEGAFNGKNTGGNHLFPTYFKNPMYRLSFDKKHSLSDATDLTIKCETESQCHIHISLQAGGGKRDVNRPCISNSSTFHEGFAMMKAQLDVSKEYTVILSQYLPSFSSRFELSLVSTLCPVLVEAIPPEDEGKIITVVKGKWTFDMCGGARDLMVNPTYILTLFERTRLTLRLLPIEPDNQFFFDFQESDNFKALSSDEQKDFFFFQELSFKT